jgi:hypothetical protein
MILSAILLGILFSTTVAQEAELNGLRAESKPSIQEQIRKIYEISLNTVRDDLTTNCEGYRELQRLQDIASDKGEIVKQLAIFVAITESEEDSHLMTAGAILEALDLQPSVPIRVLAPYLDAKDKNLRDFAQMWFHNHDSNDHIHGKPPLGSVNYHEYMEYVRARLSRKEEIPTGFIEYIYEKHPGKALLVFAKAMGVENTIAQLQAIHEAVQANRQGQERTSEEIQELRERERQRKMRQDSTKKQRGEFFLAEHIVSNAIWLNENGFADRFQQALPEAKEQLKKLAEHDQWWARLYVAEIMRRQREFRDPGLLAKLREDDNELVKKAAQAIRQ